MIPARNATDAHAQDVVVSDEFLPPILKAFAQCSRSLHATRNVWYFQSVFCSRLVCRSYQYQPSSPRYGQQVSHTMPHTLPPPWRSACGLWTAFIIYSSLVRTKPLPIIINNEKWNHVNVTPSCHIKGINTVNIIFMYFQQIVLLKEYILTDLVHLSLHIRKRWKYTIAFNVLNNWESVELFLFTSL